MKLYLETKLMTLEDGNHEIILRAKDKEFLGYDRIANSDILSKNKEGKYVIREQKTWWSFPLYELKNGKIVLFDYTQYAYFTGADRRNMLAAKINELYNPSAEAKLVRKTLKKILNQKFFEY